ncbi:MAG: type II toxin-antitoxin system HicB family antitoxin [Patescibacteria group bacterium]
MIQDYLNKYLAKARYEMIDNGANFYAEIKELRGVWAKGKTLEECRDNLLSVIESWLVIRLRQNLAVPGLPVSKMVFSPRIYA